MKIGLGNLLKPTVGAGLGFLVGGPAGALAGAGLGVTDEFDRYRDYEAQKEFAQHGVQWQARSYRRAGLSPFGGMGAGSPSYYPAGRGDSIDKTIRVGLNRESLKNAKLQNKLLGMEVRGKQRDMEDPFQNYPGVEGIESGVHALFRWSINPIDKGYYLTFNPESSEAIESDPSLRKEIDAIRMFFRGKRLGHVSKKDKEMLLRMRPPATKGYIAKWSRKTGRFYMVKKKHRNDVGLYLDPKYDDVLRKRDTLDPDWDTLSY